MIGKWEVCGSFVRFVFVGGGCCFVWLFSVLGGLVVFLLFFVLYVLFLGGYGKIGDLLLNSSNSFEFFSPSFLLDELKKHHNKLRKISTLPDKDLEFLKRMLISKIELIDLENIPPQNWNKATKLVEDIDEFDTPFIALSIALNAPLWTGDKKLIKGLRKKKFDLLLDTDSIFSIRNSI